MCSEAEMGEGNNISDQSTQGVWGKKEGEVLACKGALMVKGESASGCIYALFPTLYQQLGAVLRDKPATKEHLVGITLSPATILSLSMYIYIYP